MQIQKYMSKISGPLLDRIDIHLEVPSLPSQELLTHSTNESSAEIKSRTNQAREQQHKRLKDSGTFTNAQMSQKQLKKFCALNPTSAVRNYFCVFGV